MFTRFNKTLAHIALIALLSMAVTGCLKKAEPAAIMSVEQVALDGYDPVAYFVSSSAHKGEGSYTYSYEGVNWIFHSSDNLESFKADPVKYIPVFGGFCAYELADEELVYSDPVFWHIHNGQLFLFSSEEAKTKWFRDIDAMIPQAQAQWERLSNPPSEE